MEASYQAGQVFVQLQIGRMDYLDYDAVYDESDTDFTYTKQRLGIEFIWNPFATASNQFRDPNNVLLVAGDDPMTSVANLHQVLMSPRGKLVVTEGDITILSSPRILAIDNLGLRGPSTDAKNGPNPISLKCESVHGAKTIVGYWEVETWLAEAVLSDGAMLSNRWTMTHDVDELGMTTKTVEGTAVFRSDLLSLEAVKADDFRNRFGHPIPNNFKRTNINAALQPDGLSLKYSFTDEEQTLNLDPNKGILRVEADDEYSHDWTSGMLPTATLEHTVRIWGRRNMTRQQLAGAAITCLVNAFEGLFGKYPLFAGSVKVAYHQRYAEAHGRLSLQGVLGGVGALFAPGWQAVQNATYFETLGSFGNTADGPNIGPPGSNSTRGQFLERLVAATLQAPGVRPPIPATPGIAVDVNN